MNDEELTRVMLEIHDDHKFTFSLINDCRDAKAISEDDYFRLIEMLLETENEDFDMIILINNELIKALADCKRQKISARLVIGAEKIEGTEDPKERARLMVHYNNLLKELGA